MSVSERSVTTSYLCGQMTVSSFLIFKYAVCPKITDALAALLPDTMTHFKQEASIRYPALRCFIRGAAIQQVAVHIAATCRVDVAGPIALLLQGFWQSLS